jgi:hypothetical protein
MSERAERAERVGEVTEKLSVYWLLLVKHENSFAKGDDKKFYELVGKCFEQLWEKGVESTWQTQWKEVVVWKRVEETKPGEAERRIREQVRWRLQEARKLEYTRWWVTSGVDGIGEYVDRWFGGAEKGGAAPSETRRPTPTAADKMRDMLAELLALYGKYAKEAK